MIRHIVMWSLKEVAEGADKATNIHKMKLLLESCRNIVDGMLTLDVGLEQPGLQAGCDLILYSEFRDKAALDAYQEHPTHQAIKPFVGAVSLTRVCMDYEVG